MDYSRNCGKCKDPLFKFPSPKYASLPALFHRGPNIGASPALLPHARAACPAAPAPGKPRPPGFEGREGVYAAGGLSFLIRAEAGRGKRNAAVKRGRMTRRLIRRRGGGAEKAVRHAVERRRRRVKWRRGCGWRHKGPAWAEAGYGRERKPAAGNLGRGRAASAEEGRRRAWRLLGFEGGIRRAGTFLLLSTGNQARQDCNIRKGVGNRIAGKAAARSVREAAFEITRRRRPVASIQSKNGKKRKRAPAYSPEPFDDWARSEREGISRCPS